MKNQIKHFILNLISHFEAAAAAKLFHQFNNVTERLQQVKTIYESAMKADMDQVKASAETLHELGCYCIEKLDYETAVDSTGRACELFTIFFEEDANEVYENHQSSIISQQS